MNARLAAIAVIALAVPLLCPAQEPKLPVFFLRYDGGVGSEQIEPEDVEEEMLEPSSQRHKVTLRIKEQWSDSLTTNLYTAVSRKEYYLKSGSYTYFYLNPELAWDVTDRLQWCTGLRSKWTVFDDLQDLTSLLARTELTFRAPFGVKLFPFFEGIFDLYQDEQKGQATYIGGLGLESRLGSSWRLTARYRGIARVPLGAGSEVANRFNQEFGLNLSWDPNR
jgi:hypothetical protein